MTGARTRALTSTVRSNSVLRLASLVAVGGLIALSRRYLDLHIGIPGHTGLIWMFLLVYSRALVDRRGAALCIGISTAFWGELLGAKETLAYNLLMYASVGAVADVVASVPRINLTHPFGGLLTGGAAHTAKYGFILAHAKLLALPKKFLLVGVVEAFGWHLAFGAAGGLVAGLVLWWLARGRTGVSHTRTAKSP